MTTLKTDGEEPSKSAPKKRKMRPGGGKAKGSGFEGQVAKKLSEALYPLKFIRTQGSGARVGGKNFETLGKLFGEAALKLFVGDVTPVNEKEAGVVFSHSIECKSYKTPDGFTSLVAGTANIFKWYQEACDDAIKIKRVPLLIFKWNNTPIFVAAHSSLTTSLQETGTTVRPKLTILRDGDAMHSLDIFYLDDLLKLPGFWSEPVVQDAEIGV